MMSRSFMIYRKAANGALTLEGANLPEGRLTENGVRWHVKDHLGSVRAVVDGATGNLLAVTDYEAYGEDTANATASSYVSPTPSGEILRDGFTGKEDQSPDFGTAYTDFGARQYSPALRRWLVPDPLSEKYYDVSPYAYCAGDPVNLVDVDGNNWYSYMNSEGEIQYKYIEGQMSDKEMLEGGYTDLGYTFSTEDNYYSLYGQVISKNDIMAQVYTNIDNLLISYFTNPIDSDGMLKKTNMHLLSNESMISFSYKGKSFSSIKGITSGSPNVGDGSIYYNVPKDNASSYITNFPDKERTFPSFTRKFVGYWLTASNGKGAYEGFQVLQVKFNHENASNFIKASNRLFKKNLKMR